MADEGKLGIIAGAGALPRLIVAAARRQGRPVFIAGFKGQTDAATLQEAPHLLTRLGRAGAVVEALRREGVRDVVTAGGITRPTLAELRPDWYTARFFARLASDRMAGQG